MSRCDAHLQEFPLGGTEGFPQELGLRGWQDSKLCQTVPFATWWERQLEVMAHAHFKIIVKDEPTGDSVGGIVLLEGSDAQVGPALFCWHQYLDEDYRNTPGLWRKVMRLAQEACRQSGLKWLIWSHRDEASGRIFYTYKEVQNGRS